MAIQRTDFFLDVWAFQPDGTKVHPYKGERGDKKGLFSVNFTNDTKNFIGLTEKELVSAIEAGKFRDRGTVRMLPVDYCPGSERSAYAPVYINDRRVKDY